MIFVQIFFLDLVTCFARNETVGHLLNEAKLQTISSESHKIWSMDPATCQ